DRGAVLRTPVHELPPGVGRIDLPPEHVQQLGVRYPGGIERHLHHLHEAPFGVVLVRRVLPLPVRVPGQHLRHPVQLLEGRRHAPEAAPREHGLLGLRRGTRGGRRDGARQAQQEHPCPFHISVILPTVSAANGRFVTPRLQRLSSTLYVYRTYENT